MKIKTKGILLVFISLFLVSQAVAGWVIKEVATNSEGDKDTTIIYFQKNMFKSVDSQIMMFDLEKGLIYFIVPERKIYWRGTTEEYQKAMEEGMKQMMEEQLKKMTSEQRDAYKLYKKKMEKEAKKVSSQKKIKVVVKKTSEKSSFAGYSGQKYQVLVDGKLKEELWICAKINLKDEIDLNKLIMLMNAMSGPGEKDDSYEYSPEYVKLMEQGYPLKSIEYDDEGNKEDVTEAVKVEKKNIPNSEFKAPKGYRKLSASEFIKGMIQEGNE